MVSSIDDTDTSTHLLKLEDKLNRVLRTIKSSIDDTTYHKLLASGSRPGFLYGLPKIHKLGNPLRPIISAIGCFNYHLAKFLVPVLAPLTTNQFTIENSSSFNNDINSLNYHRPVTMCSFDIESLFTNVPLHETTDLIVNNTSTAQLESFGLNKKVFPKLLDIAAHHSVFSFEGSLYTQVDGVSMGSPIGPSYANSFLCHHETTWLNDCPISFKPIFYKRYIDDTFLIFEHQSHFQLFLDYLNSRHPSIKFTCEVEEEGKLSFLDTTITNNNGQFSTSTYRKKTFTGLGLHYLSFLPPIYKFNSIKTLLTRAYNVCSSWKAFHNEIVFLHDYFLYNGYPSQLVDKTINTFLNRKLTPPPLPVTTVNKHVLYFKLPYMGKLSFEIRKSMKEILKDAYPQIKFNFVFTNNISIGNFLKKISNPNPDLCSNVVYLFKCPSCPARYVGSTSRWLKQ